MPKPHNWNFALSLLRCHWNRGPVKTGNWWCSSKPENKAWDTCQSFFWGAVWSVQGFGHEFISVKSCTWPKTNSDPNTCTYPSEQRSKFEFKRTRKYTLLHNALDYVFIFTLRLSFGNDLSFPWWTFSECCNLLSLPSQSFFFSLNLIYSFPTNVFFLKFGCGDDIHLSIVHVFATPWYK